MCDLSRGDPSRRRVLAAYRGRGIKNLMVGLDGQMPVRKLGSGETGIMFLDVALRGAARRSGLCIGSCWRWGRVAVRRGTLSAETPLPVSSASHPFASGHRCVARIWRCGLLRSRAGASSRAHGGRPPLSLSQRYAIDFVRVDEQLQTSLGDPARNGSYFVFGAEVIAVAPGRVVATRSDLPDGTPPDEPPADLDTAAGNYVTQDLGGGRSAL